MPTRIVMSMQQQPHKPRLPAANRDPARSLTHSHPQQPPAAQVTQPAEQTSSVAAPAADDSQR